MPPSRFNRDAWPEDGPHRELLELLDGAHVDGGARSLRALGKDMHVAYTRVHAIVSGRSLPASDAQTRALVAALTNGAGDDLESRAVELYRSALRARLRASDEPIVPVNAEPPAAEDRDVPKAPVRHPRRARAALLPVAIAAAAVAGGALYFIPDTTSDGPEPASPAVDLPSVRYFSVDPDAPDGCSSVYRTTGMIEGDVDETQSMWLVSQLYGNGSDRPDPLYYPKVRLAPERGGVFTEEIAANRVPGDRQGRILLVLATTPAADAEMQLSYDSDVMRDDGLYADGRRVDLPTDVVEIATGPPLDQRC